MLYEIYQKEKVPTILLFSLDFNGGSLKRIIPKAKTLPSLSGYINTVHHFTVMAQSNLQSPSPICIYSCIPTNCHA